ncbi:mechanosensitive ion channel family protein [Streptomyces jeddahensis]|uniref:Miniconductance mechanosensitive channel MscM n=1 Tax=Streptomyces jeddahensis TaxID=1716141 RepID=A0A177HU67_9ACTN|nr:mechanosensitive ion channel domain-containing protein [Streptomyces jeddahensis]OAH14433.1 miniconductance mechanosensitive channel MscM precursor [Streptomyces jeddahensis]
MDNVLRPLIVIGGSVVLTFLVGWVVDRLLRRADDRHNETPLWGLLRRCRLPLQVVLCTGLLRGSYEQARIAEDHAAAIGRVLSLVLIGSTAWLVIRIAAAVVESSYARYAAARRDPARVRRVRTQVTLIQRVVSAVVGVVAAAAMLLTFPAMRTAGASLLASAGILGIVAGIAAQSTLGNLFAGLQIAFGDMVRLGDTVVVDGEWGTVDEITLTFLTVRTWDERRITMPVSYFTSKPFENWSRGGAQMTGTVFFHLDHRAPVPEMREKLAEIVRACPAWDGRAWGLDVTDTTPTTMEVRALVTAKDPDDIWTVRVTVREQLIRWLTEEHPYALPRVTTAQASLPPAIPHQVRGPGAPSKADQDQPGGGTVSARAPHRR